MLVDKNKEYLKSNIDELGTNSKIKILETCRGASWTSWWVTSLEQNTVKEEKGDLVTDCHNIMAIRRNHFSHYWMYMGLMMLGRQKYIQQRH